MTTPEPVKADSRLGQVVSGRYRIQQLLGEGGMGSVYLAEHTHMKKRVALKLLHPEMSQNAEVSARFEREAMAAAHIEHPNVAAATDFGKTEDGSFFLVLEYLEGTSLRDAMAGGPMGVLRALRITRQIALALERAHGTGIVHRDLKPENVMLVRKDDEPDFVKVLDFGIAKLTDVENAIGERAAGTGQVLTRLGTIIGTPEYMAPEQALGEAVSNQSDLYAVGVMLYEMLTGKHPFDPPDRTTMLTFHIVAPVPPMADRAPEIEVPPAVEAVARSLLEKEQKKRPASARALVEAIGAAAVASGIDLGAGGIAPPAVSSRRSLADKDTPPPGSVVHPDAYANTTLGERAASSDARIMASAEPMLEAPVSGSAATSIGPGHAGAARVEPGGGRGAGSAAARIEELVGIVKRLPRNVQIGLAAAVPLLGIAVVVILVLLFRGPKETGASGFAGGTTGEDGGVAAKITTAPPDRLKAAVAQGPEAVEALAKEFAEDAAVKKQLVLSYHQAGRSVDAMSAVRPLLAADPKAADDEEIVQVVSTTASKNTKGTGDADDEAFVLLEGPLGEKGVDALIEMSRNNANWALKTRAGKSLQKPEVRAKASAAASVYLDFASAQSCGQKKELLPKVKESGDTRLLPALKALKATNGCKRGLFKRVDCWPCLRDDGALEDAIAAVETRGRELK
ncbi:MAG: serine/threonine protein kinase [Deltaproteobacteria bacterium]|nr:serine/threonine protein kinase [Deltaproteobacteria bacterium]